MTAHVPMSRDELLALAPLKEGMNPTEKRLYEELLWQRNATLSLVKMVSGGSARHECGVSVYWMSRASQRKDALAVSAIGAVHVCGTPPPPSPSFPGKDGEGEAR